MSSAPAVYWIVAGRCTKTQSKDGLHSILKSRVGSGKGLCEEAFPLLRFNVPDGEHSLKFGSFDNLIRLTDDLAKYDAQVEGVLRRLERQCLEIDARTNFTVQSQRESRSFEDYMRRWQWDDAKYPKSRAILDNLQLLITSVTRLEEEARNKASHFSDLKSQKGSLAKQAGTNLWAKDLIDVLVPEVVRDAKTADDDFIYTEHLTTVVVVVHSERVDDLHDACLKSDNLVPNSARRLGPSGRGRIEDHDGNQLWRVVLFKTAVEDFRRNCRQRRLGLRDFEYNEEAYRKAKLGREQFDKEFDRHHLIFRRFCLASWSDAMIAWFHIKAMRVFVESVLRFGVPPHFAAFLIQPKVGQEAAVRKELTSVLRLPGSWGDDVAAAVESERDIDRDEEEYFPYVSLTFQPFCTR